MKIGALSVITTLSMCIFFSCKKQCDSDDFQYNGTDIFFPEKDSINMGDTLFVSCRILKSGIPAGLNHPMNLGGNLFILNIDSFSLPSRGAVLSFRFLNIEGSLYPDYKLRPTEVKQISYEETDTSYNLLAGLIAQKKGSFVFDIRMSQALNGRDLVNVERPLCILIMRM